MRNHQYQSIIRQQGFTLLEIMLVIALIAIITTSVGLGVNIENEKEKKVREVQRMHAVINAAAEYAMLNQVELGLLLDDVSYKFLAFDGQKWRPMGGQKIFEPQEFSDGIELKLELEGLEWSEDNLLGEVSWSDEELNDDDEEKLTPQIFILSSGDLTPFLISVSIDVEDEEETTYFQLKGNFTFPVELIGPSEEAL
jgi:general secretion pathway protein H